MRPVAEHRFAVDDFFPANIELRGDFRAPGEDGTQIKLNMGLSDDFLEDEAFMYFVPAIGKSAGVEEDDAVAGDAEVFEMGVKGENAPLPAGLTEIQEAVEPDMDFVETLFAGELREVFMERGLHAGGSFGNGQPAGPAADVNANGRKSDNFRDQRRAGQMGLGKAFAAAITRAVDPPNILDMGAEPEASGDDAHYRLYANAKKAEEAGWTLEDGAGQQFPNQD